MFLFKQQSHGSIKRLHFKLILQCCTIESVHIGLKQLYLKTQPHNKNKREKKQEKPYKSTTRSCTSVVKAPNGATFISTINKQTAAKPSTESMTETSIHGESTEEIRQPEPPQQSSEHNRRCHSFGNIDTHSRHVIIQGQTITVPRCTSSLAAPCRKDMESGVCLFVGCLRS